MPRRALITGGGVRVGRAIALKLGSAGYDIGVHFHSSERGAEEVVAALRSDDRRAIAVAADLSRPEEIAPLVRTIARELGGLDLLVNSAALFPRSPPEQVSAEAWDRVFAVNARAPFLCAVAAAIEMGEAGGSVINIADVAAFEAWPNYAPYAASKAALVSLTRSLARAWAPRIRVNAVAPGPVLLPDGTGAAEAERAAARTAQGRIGRPEDVADAVLYLDRAAYVTGEVIRVDGGGHLR